MAATKTKKAKKKSATKTTRLGFVIDESGSMGGTERSVTEGYNEFVSTLQDEAPDPELVFGSLAFFDAHGNDPKVRFKREQVALSEMPELALTDYRPRGLTPLNDAISEMIEHLGKAAGGDEQVMLVIVTDGHENKSETSTDDLRKLVMAREKDGWEFIYLGANVDAFAESQKIGMSGKAGSYAGFTSSPVGTSNTMKRSGTLASSYARGGASGLAATQDVTPDVVPEDPAAFAAQEAEIKKAREEFEKSQAEAQTKATEQTKTAASEAAKGVFRKDE